MRDLEIVALLAVGDPAGLEEAYAAYADRIHDYARWMLRGSTPEAAADVTQDTFLIAMAKAGSLRDPSRLRSWLYAIARNECLRVLRATPAAERSPDPSTDLTAEGLAPEDREVFELGFRHDLSGPEVARSLGLTENAAHAMLSRVRSRFEKRGMSPAALLSTPFLAAPAAVRSRVLERRTELVSYSRMLAGRAGPFDADGFPGLPAPDRRRRGALAALVAVLLLLGGFGAATTLAASPGPEVVEQALGVASGPSTPASTSYAVAPSATLRPRVSTVVEPIEETSTTPTATASATPTVTPRATVSATRSPTRTPEPKPTTKAPVPQGTLTAAPGSFTLEPGASGTVTLRASGGPVDWTASWSGPIESGPTSGSLSAGSSTSLTVTSTASTPVTVSVSAGGRHVTISAG